MPRKAESGSTRKVQIITMMSADDAEAIKKIAADDDMTVSQLVRRIVKKELGLSKQGKWKKRKRAE